MQCANGDRITILDDRMFGSVFRDPAICREFLERVLKIKIDEILIPDEQKALHGNFYDRGIRLDVYVRDTEGNSYDIEMQNFVSRFLELRTRYYHSEMDLYQIQQGCEYKDLKDSIVIFICNFDLFKENRSIYTFESRCTENNSLVLNEKRKTIFLNINGRRDGVSEDIINMLDYMKSGITADDYTIEIDKKVSEIYNDTDWRNYHMTIQQELDLRYEYGKTDAMLRLVKLWTQRGKTIKQIAEELDVSEKYVSELLEGELSYDNSTGTGFEI